LAAAELATLFGDELQPPQRGKARELGAGTAQARVEPDLGFADLCRRR